ncbi:MAG: flagellar basal body P-ring protein FlgI [Planctomycetaceae bacterium]|nr:flagellar basal body P-ring protein FlgI [Planctomycetaceae bacterium]
MDRRTTLMVGICLLLGGCAGASVRSQSPEAEDLAADQIKLVGDFAVSHGMSTVHVEAIGLVTGLPGTGSDPEPSPERSALLDEMQKRGVIEPNKVLASPTTSLVLVQGFLRPGIQKGDRFDVEVRIPTRSETTSLRGGWLMETRLRELTPIDNQIREGYLLGLAEGPILVDPEQSGAENTVALGRGRVLGGGVAVKSRPMRLLLKPDARATKEQGVRTAAAIEGALNRRFATYVGGIKTGVATAKTDEYLDLTVHPRYKDNIARYVRVLQGVPLKENAVDRLQRIKLLERQLLDPVTCDSAALKLEALGHEGIPVLAQGITAEDPLIQFYSAEALAYLDDSRAAEPLATAAKEQPAFRVFALAALSAMDDFAAYDALRSLLEVNSAETRYGAFRALWAMNAQDPLVRGEQLGDQFSYHLLDSKAPALIHVTRSYRPEIVLFGPRQRFKPPLMLEPNKQLLVKVEKTGQVSVSRFAVGEPREERVVGNSVDEVIRAIVELGGTYPDVVQMLQQAKSHQGLEGRLEVDAVPQPGREYTLPASLEPAAGGTLTQSATISNPLPDLYNSRVGKKRPADNSGDEPSGLDSAGDDQNSDPTGVGLLNRIKGWRRS